MINILKHMFASLELLLLEHSLGQSLSGNKKKRESCSSCATSISDGTKTDVYAVTQRPDSSHLLVNSLAILLMPLKKKQKKTKESSALKVLLRKFWRSSGDTPYIQMTFLATFVINLF